MVSAALAALAAAAAVLPSEHPTARLRHVLGGSSQTVGRRLPRPTPALWAVVAAPVVAAVVAGP
ncbi:hypothetical protein ACFQ34_04365, partial [Pseudonocardia benzenivorans]